MFAAGTAIQTASTIASAASTASSVASGVSAADSLLTNLLPEDTMESSPDDLCLSAPRSLLTHDIMIELQLYPEAMNLLRAAEKPERRSFLANLCCPCPPDRFHEIILSNALFQNSIQASVKRPADISAALQSFKEVTFLGARHQLSQAAWSTFIIVALIGQIADTKSEHDNRSYIALVSGIISIILQHHSRRYCFVRWLDCSSSIEKQTQAKLINSCSTHQMIFKQNAHRPPSFEWGKNYRTLIANINSLSRAIKHALAQQLGKKTIYTDLFNDPNSTHWKGLLKQQGVDIKVGALLMSGVDLHSKLDSLVYDYKHRGPNQPCANIIFYVGVIYELVTFVTHFNDELSKMKSGSNRELWWLNSTVDLAWGILSAILTHTVYNTAFSRAIISGLLNELHKFQSSHSDNNSQVVQLTKPVTDALGHILAKNLNQYGENSPIIRAFSTVFSYSVTDTTITTLIDQLRDLIINKSTLPRESQPFPAPCVFHYLLLVFAVNTAKAQYIAATSVQTSKVLKKLEYIILNNPISEGVLEQDAHKAVLKINAFLQEEYSIPRIRYENYYTYFLLLILYRFGLAAARDTSNAAENQQASDAFVPVESGKLVAMNALTVNELLPRRRGLIITFLPPPEVIVAGNQAAQDSHSNVGSIHSSANV